MEKNLLRIAITHGDINGIGYEILLKAFAEPMFAELFCPIVYGSAVVEKYWRDALQIESEPWQLISQASEARPGQVNLIDVCGEQIQVQPGEANRTSGMAALAALERAMSDIKSRQCDALVTAPINKSAMPVDVFPFKGHTDYLAHKCGAEARGLMILFSDECRVALATTHCALQEVSQHLSVDLIVDKLQQMEHSLIQDFGIVKPRIALLSVNPHASDHGLMGDEEERILLPALEQAQREHILCFGPYAADGFWGSDSSMRFDAILAIYHDQGLAPFKALYMNRGVNFTANLPFVRTSPDHGTGYDIVGKGVASEESLRSAVYAAIDIYRARSRYQEATKSPLRKTYFEKGNDNEKLETPPGGEE
ncbi:4-hydroxythreonine-4-phosphate dehydrogenase 2 [Porphyromonas crevioricanis]|uniref:4-hydroxythreonine-4-phosphate dehydrogenase 2 n=1 Tax=Porphyromonas crevioricanis TaxID=393921 RepID=A0A2X4PVU6_9PORP|nr:4-hydroxythreonine-4-phosphate dehydrogenase PdxA [Porphyromonas crevioricanis]GAD07495.1 4-hydroxythreonine-4-phosphate dehydrogenase [Porphyromonas crevioricanis JCM 13913]SQH72639.1 4-hydroxythreonine-4-phosphate dehydrogenase 2 [Porphyromonas crevioricanis]